MSLVDRDFCRGSLSSSQIFKARRGTSACNAAGMPAPTKDVKRLLGFQNKAGCNAFGRKKKKKKKRKQKQACLAVHHFSNETSY